MNEHKHIDPEPDRRYIIKNADGLIDSATVIEATDQNVRLKWDRDGSTQWYPYEQFQKSGGHDWQSYRHLQILEQLETPR